MTNQENMIRTIGVQLDQLFAAARKIPADKLDWKPTANSRSALDQVQEVATSYEEFKDAHLQRKVEFSPEKFGAWMERRSQVTDLDELEKIAKENHEKLYEDIRKTPDEDMTLSVEMPFPGTFDLAYIFNYYAWNAGYHEGQINYINGLIEGGLAG